MSIQISLTDEQARVLLADIDQHTITADEPDTNAIFTAIRDKLRRHMGIKAGGQA